MPRYSREAPSELDGIAEILDKHPSLASMTQEIASDPKSFYEFNSGIEEHDGRIRLIPNFDETVVIERCHTVSTDALRTQQDLSRFIDKEVESMSAEEMHLVFVPLSQAIKNPEYASPRPVKKFFERPILRPPVDEYSRTLHASFDEVFWWCRHSGSLERILNFATLLEEPIVAQNLLQKFAQKERHFYGMSTDIEATLNSDALHNMRVRETRDLVDKYAKDANRRTLKEKLHGHASVGRHLLVGALALFNYGASKEKEHMYQYLRLMAKQPPVQDVLLHKTLHAHGLAA